MVEKGASPDLGVDDPSEIVVRPNLFRYSQGVFFFMFLAVMLLLLGEGQLESAIIALVFVVYSGIIFSLALTEWLKVDSSGFTHRASFRTRSIPSGDVTRIHYEVGVRRYTFIIVTGYEASLRFPLQYRHMGAFCQYVMRHYPRELWLTAEGEMSRRIEQDERKRN